MSLGFKMLIMWLICSRVQMAVIVIRNLASRYNPYTLSLLSTETITVLQSVLLPQLFLLKIYVCIILPVSLSRYI